MKQIFLLGCFVVSALGDPTVNGLLGEFTGKIQRIHDVDVELFLGIPYAKPPVGDLRFALPEPFGAVGELKAIKYGASCPQMPSVLSQKEFFNEDCLFINVIRKKDTTKDDRKAVSRFQKS